MHYIPGGALLFAVTPLLILGYFAWRNWGAEHLDVALYAVKIENLVTTPQPTWIRNSKVREEVFKDSSLGQLSVLDPQASATIAHAFESHSWVQRASRVQKLPGGKVTVDILYRRPIAMVYYDGNANPSSANVKNGFFPVDEEGVVLPLADFDESQVRNYFVVIAEGAIPPSVVGMTYSDTRIKQALLLCRLLDSARAELRLAGITVVRDDRMGGPNPWIMHINTSDNNRLINWGHAPGSESPGEPTPQEKFTNLVKWHTDASSSLQIDLTKPFVRETKLTGH